MASNSSLHFDDTSKVVQRLRAGGTEELARHFARLRPSIRAMLAQRLHGKLLSRLDASDVVQETFIRACRALDTYLTNPNIHPTIWLRILGKQVLAELVRKQYRLKRSPDCEQVNLDNDQVVGFLVDSLDSAGQKLQKDELVVLVRKLLSEISAADREILEMRHAEGYSFQEIGDLLEVKNDAAKKRYYRSLSRFRDVVLRDSNVDLQEFF